MKIGKKEYKDRTYIMGILNVTPDSFSDGGIYNSVDKALFRVEKMLEDGADIIDVGGESTRPGYTMISEKEEIHRILPVIEAIHSRFDCPISVDTYKSAVAKAALSSGAEMINDIWGFQYDKMNAEVCAQMGASCCLMHNSKDKNYDDFVSDMLDTLKESTSIALKAGIDKDKILIDPGVGFGKNYEHNLIAVNNLERLAELGFPYMLAASRKSFIGIALDEDVSHRLSGTLATTVLAVVKGALFVRVHDIKANKEAITMTEKILGRA